MKITTVRLTGRQVIDLPIFGASLLSRYWIKAFDGLGPADIEVFLSKGLHGKSLYSGSRPLDKQPVFRIGLNPAYLQGETHSDLRRELHGLLSPGVTGEVKIQLLNGSDVVAETSGWAKKFEQVQFTKDPEVQITFQTGSPYLFDPDWEELIPAPDTYYSGNPILFENSGTAPSGFIAEYKFTADTGNWFGLTDPDDNIIMYIGSLTHNWKLNDRIVINTNYGQRKITWYDAGVAKDVIHLLSGDSIWPQLEVGLNEIGTYPFNYSYWQSFKYQPKYWGV